MHIWHLRSNLTMWNSKYELQNMSRGNHSKYETTERSEGNCNQQTTPLETFVWTFHDQSVFHHSETLKQRIKITNSIKIISKYLCLSLLCS